MTSTAQKVFDLTTIDISWRNCLEDALEKMDPHYLAQLLQNPQWLPGKDKIFNAFSLPIDQVKYVLFGESPYPRKKSANGYAFWDAAVNELWSPTGLSKTVNRATSLRNIIKMLLIADGALTSDATGQSDIAALNKKVYVQTNDELFNHFINHGFLLLNASLVLQSTPVRQDAIAWHPFIKKILDFLFENNSAIKLILFGKIANTIDQLIDHDQRNKLYAEHPYNISFITNPAVIDFFQPLQLLRKPC